MDKSNQPKTSESPKSEESQDTQKEQSPNSELEEGKPEVSPETIAEAIVENSTPEKQKELKEAAIRLEEKAKEANDLSLKEKTGEKQPSSSLSEEERKLLDKKVVLVSVRVTTPLLEKNFELVEKGFKEGDMIDMALNPMHAMGMMANQIRRLERIVELLHHVKPSQLTTPDSAKLKSELDKMVLHFTL